MAIFNKSIWQLKDHFIFCRAEYCPLPFEKTSLPLGLIIGGILRVLDVHENIHPGSWLEVI